MESIPIPEVERNFIVLSYASLLDFTDVPKAMCIFVSSSINTKEYANNQFL
jgi:hypothetical protein